MAQYKKKKCQTLIVMGCLVQRYYQELKQALPEVDLWIPIKEYDTLWEQIETILEKQKSKIAKQEIKNNKKQENKIINTYQMDPMPMLTQEEYLGRVLSTGPITAYLKIGEGCSNRCTYCAIPAIRGPFVSRKMEDILEEAKKLAEKGIQELIVIAQDTTKYGIDRKSVV